MTDILPSGENTSVRDDACAPKAKKRATKAGKSGFIFVYLTLSKSEFMEKIQFRETILSNIAIKKSNCWIFVFGDIFFIFVMI